MRARVHGLRTSAGPPAAPSGSQSPHREPQAERTNGPGHRRARSPQPP